MRSANVGAELRWFNPIIRGWANYFRAIVAKRTFTRLDDWMFRRAVRYTRHSHPTKSCKWISKRF